MEEGGTEDLALSSGVQLWGGSWVSSSTCSPTHHALCERPTPLPSCRTFQHLAAWQ